MVFGKRRTNLANFSQRIWVNDDDEIEWRFLPNPVLQKILISHTKFGEIDPKVLQQILSNSVLTNSSGLAKFVPYNRGLL